MDPQFLGLAGSLLAILALVLFVTCIVRAALRELARDALRETQQGGGDAVEPVRHTGIDIFVGFCCLAIAVVVSWLL